MFWLFIVGAAALGAVITAGALALQQRLRRSDQASANQIRVHPVERLFLFYIYKAIAPMVAVLAVSVATLIAVLWGISVIEEQRGRATAFELEISALGGAPLWVLLAASMLVVNGLTMSRWAIVTADVGRRQLGTGYEVNVPLPLGKIAATNVIYIGAAVLCFYVVRTVIW